MDLFLFVDVMNHRGKRRGLPTTGRTGDQNKPLVITRQGCNNVRKAQTFERWWLGWYHTDNGLRPLSLFQNVRSETSDSRSVIAKIQIEMFFKMLLLFRSQDFLDER